MEDLKLKTAEFEKRSIPFKDSALTPEELQASLTDKEMAVSERFFIDVDEGKVNAMVQTLTPESIRLWRIISKERNRATLAISRWNFVAKSIKYSFLSLVFSMIAGYSVGWLLLDTIYNPFEILIDYVGRRWMGCWFLASFFGSLHNIYDSLRFPSLVRKVNRFIVDWLEANPKANNDDYLDSDPLEKEV